jgi:hypothetical protein
MIMLATTSFSIAQSSGKGDEGLLAKAEIHSLTVPYNIRDDETFKRNYADPRSGNAEKDYRSNAGAGDISLAVKNELKSEENSDSSYHSSSLKVEDIPLVMSSADRNTISVVLPPFLYFKTQF